MPLPSHASFFVEAEPSSHGVVAGLFTTVQPLPFGVELAWHCVGVQVSGVPAHVPLPLQTSFAVFVSPSPHGVLARFLTMVQSVPFGVELAWHCVGVQLYGVPPQ